MSNIDEVLKTMELLQGELKELKGAIQFAKQMANPTPRTTPLTARKRVGRPPRNGPAVEPKVQFGSFEAD